ncbi:MAG: hypothetical protein J5806_11905 [Lentisphaeria bacterium]|nr:hypothetical protein [Lentisphaeria bacterium]
MKRMMFLGLAAALLMMCGCRTQIITVDVVPADATVIANGVEYRNKCPMFIETPTGKQLMITAYKEGYRERIYAIDYKLSTVGKIETITGCFLLLPFIGLCFDNAWELKETNVFLTLDPVSEEAIREAQQPQNFRMFKRRGSAAEEAAEAEARKTFSEL